MPIEHINPESMHVNPAFSQATVVPANMRTIYVGGQNGVDADGNVVGGGVGAQTEQALKNLLEVLKTAGATQADVAKLNIHVSADADFVEAYAASAKVWGMHATAITVLLVPGFARPEVLVEIDAIAAVEA